MTFSLNALTNCRGCSFGIDLPENGEMSGSDAVNCDVLRSG